MSSFLPRGYDEIVRDLLTTLTGGTVRETLAVPPGDAPLRPLKLRDRPVRRVSHLQGEVELQRATGGPKRVPYRFTRADFELVASTPGSDELDAIAFRDGARRPRTGSSLTVNYYPVASDPVPLTDLNVGSVTRTLVETFARELALVQHQLQHVYDSAFVETAEGTSLERVVALVGVARLAAGHPVARVRCARRPGDPGRVTVPASTPLVDADGNRYLTVETVTLEPGESSRDTFARGETPATPPVEAGALRMEVLVAGLSEITNPQPARALDAAEPDDALRRRARAALHGTARGTREAIEFAVRSVDGVSDVTLVEAPNGVPGEVRVVVAYADDDTAARAQVRDVVEDHRAAGIRVPAPDEAARRSVGVRLELVLAGAGLGGDELAALRARLEERIADHIARTPPGGTVRRARLTALVLEETAVLDARVLLTPAGGAEAEEVSAAAGEVLDPEQPFGFTVTAERAPAEAQRVAVSALLPLHLAAGVTEAEARAAVETAFDAHLATRGPDAPLTFDGLAAAVRDPSRFALVRNECLVTVEVAGTFRQLTDGVGAYAPAPGEEMRRDAVDLDVREEALPS